MSESVAGQLGGMMPQSGEKGTIGPKIITTLLKAGANPKLKSNEGKTAFDYAEENEKVRGTAAYWELNKATL